MSMRRRIRAMDPERKFQDIASTFSPLTAGFFFLVNSVAQGVTENTRIGNAALWTSFQFRATISKNPGQDIPLSAVLRVIVFSDVQPQGSPLPIASLLSASGTPIESPYELNFNRRFRIYHDRTYTVTPSVTQRTIKVYIRLHLQTRYSGPTGSLADLQQNALNVLWFSDQGAVGSAPQVDWIARVRFVG